MPHTKRYRIKSSGFRALTLHGGATGRLADQAYAVPFEGDVLETRLKVSLRDTREKVESHSNRLIQAAGVRHRLSKRRTAEQAADIRAAWSADPQVTVLRGDAFDTVVRQLDRPAEPSEASREQVARHRLWRK